MSAYYKVSFGTGMAWLDSYTVKVDEPTTDMQAIVDILIDYLVEERHPNILDMDEYEWDEKGETLHEIDKSDWIIYPDTFVTGGNCGDVLMHYGDFRIEDVTEQIKETYGDVIVYS